MNYVLGLDAGSSIVKAACFDTDGRMVSLSARRTPLDRSAGGRVEADPDLCWRATCAVLREAVERSGVPRDRILGLGISAAMVGLWLLDAEGTPLRPGINWEDSRSQALLDRMANDRPRFMSEIFATSGSVLQQGCTLPLLAMLDREEPAIVARTHAAVSYKDFLRARLTGQIAIDRTEAAVAPGDARSQSASADMRDLFGLSHLAHLFPDPSDSASQAGTITAEAASATGLPKGLPVATGCGDVPATVIGAGGLAPGSATAVLGTTCMLGRVSDAPIFTPPDLGLLFSLPGGMWYRSMVNVAGTLNLDWAMRLLAPDLVAAPDGFARLEEEVAAVPVGARGVSYLPYLSESGIIAPRVAPAARAGFAGLAPSHGRAEMLRAVLEGVAFAIGDLADTLDLPRDAPVTLTGGGANGHLWCDMIATVLDREIAVPEGSEFGARGAAMLAAVMAGAHLDIATASLGLGKLGARHHSPISADIAGWRAARASYTAHRDRLLGL
ncbi:FGGY-family carbohydrate kinase [Palleronia sp. LCG004]|uniref:FGGY-family carbohydrate kinase n=1 Tax=Palleronia sp. LCG004 TaxID=3079304 RepID=UPI002943A0EC|nr:FGGY-family carbohydrate kinase [Palleronia sp. LCG004]WOI55855.1 FGGY-family carbohydrate kinase [Palleronia sp. LCG004]